MNRILGVIALNQSTILLNKISQCSFQSPHWQADHQAIFLNATVAMSATQRFITPECSHGLMPIQHQASECVIIADVYLTNRKNLCQKLGCDLHLSDAELMLHAYLKWGEHCTSYFAGAFCFAIWDAKRQRLMVATDQLGSCPLYYAYKPGHYFIFANEMSAFRPLCTTLSTNEALFKGFVLDAQHADETCYVEVKKLFPAHHGILNLNQWITRRYWSLKEEKKTVCYRSREEYFEAFREVFQESVCNAMRTSSAITAHISGGLDSSSIACQAAHQLGQNNQPLFAMTAIPIGLDGPSYRKGWYYHEMPRVQSILNQYANIRHEVYSTKPDANIYELLHALYPHLDQPVRNVFNFDWIAASLEYAKNQKSRVLLTGQHGNGGFSWAGLTVKNRLGLVYDALGQKILKKNAFDAYYHYVHPHLLSSAFGKQRIQARTAVFNRRYAMLSGELNAALQSTMRTASLWYGVEMLDPTRDLALIQFCHQVPEWVHYRGNAVLKRRLLVREGLVGLVPNDILQNPYRGEQGADWYLQYNRDAHQWQSDLQGLSTRVQETLWQCYDQSKIMALFDAFPSPIQSPDAQNMLAVGLVLSRCLSSGLYLKHLTDSLSQYS